MLLSRFVPESPRWLIAVGKREEALRVLKEAATTNKMNPCAIQDYLERLPTTESSKSKPKLSTLFHGTLRKRTILLSSNWYKNDLTL